MARIGVRVFWAVRRGTDLDRRRDGVVIRQRDAQITLDLNLLILEAEEKKSPTHP